MSNFDVSRSKSSAYIAVEAHNKEVTRLKSELASRDAEIVALREALVNIDKIAGAETGELANQVGFIADSALNLDASVTQAAVNRVRADALSWLLDNLGGDIAVWHDREYVRVSDIKDEVNKLRNPDQANREK